MKPNYDVIESENGDDTRDVIFAFENEIENGSCGNVCFVPSKLSDALQDNGESCEDYIVNTKLTEEEIVLIMNKFGYVRNTEIRDLMWN